MLILIRKYIQAISHINIFSLKKSKLVFPMFLSAFIHLAKFLMQLLRLGLQSIDLRNTVVGKRRISLGNLHLLQGNDDKDTIS